jgi:prepilin-type N-terminal cleavage/methylation domain-containing protein
LACIEPFDRPGTSRRPGGGRGGTEGGFTLIELLVVIAIIALLAGILVPTIQRGSAQTYATRSAAHMKAISNGLEMFHQDMQFYPGQMDFDNMHGLTATEVLVRYLCTTRDRREQWARGWGSHDADDIFTSDFSLQNAYIDPQDEGGLVDDDIGSATGFAYVPVDGFPERKAMPICYWPARKGAGAWRDAFKPNHNHEHSNNQTMVPWIDLDDADGRATWKPFVYDDNRAALRTDRYVLISAGIDREWFTNDDQTNLRK